MDIINKVIGIVTSIFDSINGHKTEYGLKIMGIAGAITGAMNLFGFHPAFIDPILSILTQVGGWLTGGGLAHKALKIEPVQNLIQGLIQRKPTAQ